MPKPCFVLGLRLPVECPGLMEDVGASLAYLDMQHGAFDVSYVLSRLQKARKTRQKLLVRIPDIDYPDLKDLVAAGAAGIIVPQVECALKLKKIREAITIAASENNSFSMLEMRGKVEVNKQHNNQPGPVLIAMVENQTGAEQAKQLHQQGQPDALVVGCSDMTADLGCPKDYAHPELVNIVDRVIGITREYSCLTGIFGLGRNPDKFRFFSQFKPDLISLGSEKEAMRQQLQTAVRQFTALATPL